tara:strand:+ start:173 stop:607 length:435 start_codon:yes stop_codon:yes gene_type:complete
MNTKTNSKTQEQPTLGQQLTNNAVHIEGNKGFNFARPAAKGIGNTQLDFSPALAMTSAITVTSAPQVQIVMQAWLELSKGKGSVTLEAISDHIMAQKGLWFKSTGVPYNQDVYEIVNHYRLRLAGVKPWGAKGKKGTLKLCDFS